MRVFLTFDYELFFGSRTGSIQKCLLEPTNELLRMARKYSVPMTFFVDIGYLIQLQNFSKQFSQLADELKQIEAQLYRIQELGCELQLHIHPHWEKAFYDGSKWVIDARGCYKLSDFSRDEANGIVRKYYDALAQYAKNKINAFRAGGWCIQPFEPLAEVFAELGIRFDSSVFPQGKFESEHYAFDFTAVEPFVNCYAFEIDVCAKEENGRFIEVPISSWYYKPLFFWKLYGWGRVKPSQHKMIGDGNFIPQPNRKKTSLMNATWNHVSCDGYFASQLNRQLKYYRHKNVSDFVVIGHPKSSTRYSLKKLEQFIQMHNGSNQFSRFSDQ